ncbi:hypothetical protein HDU96_004285 [Phlyctochytrium bullatum]|nr:hypothetical protein HDU96_004285 [Phlyctochytrium bullatum]
MTPLAALSTLLMLLAAIINPLPATAQNTAFIAPTQASPRKIVSVEHRLFYDDLGRARVFRGTNVVYKAAPYKPDTSPDAAPARSFNIHDIRILAENGVTAIRLGVMWPGVEPVRGQFDASYLATMKQIVSMCRDAGIYVLLDMHQDVLSEKFCGEGVPLWAAQPAKTPFDVLAFPRPVLKDKYRVDANGVPSPADCARKFWSDYHLSHDVGSAYQRIYDNHDGLRDSFVNYWKVVADTMKGFTNILGYDLMNEPWAGNHVANPTLLVPGVADKKNLLPFYDAAAKGIREVDPDAIIFFESVTWDNFIVGFDRVPGGDAYKKKSVLSFHHYSPRPNLLDLNGTLIERSLDMARLGCGGMLTEFEMGWQEGRNVQAIREKSALMERFFFSYLGWEYTDYVPMTGTNNGLRDPTTGAVRPDMAAVYSRPYATAIPGVPLATSFDDATGRFVLSYRASGRGVLEVRAGAPWHYPGGMVVRVRDGGEGAEVRMAAGVKKGTGGGGGWTVGVEEGAFVFVEGGAEGKMVTVTIERA